MWFPELILADYVDNVWSFNVSSKLWTWQTGCSIHGTRYPVYGKQGVSVRDYASVLVLDSVQRTRRTHLAVAPISVSLFPAKASAFGCSGATGHVIICCCWHRLSVCRADADYFNDVWSFSTISKQWTWQAGNSTTHSNSPVYGAQGVPVSKLCNHSFTLLQSATTNPGARYACQIALDSNDLLWLFGGLSWSISTQTALTC